MNRVQPVEPRDPGLQPERTGLAWSRTAFVMLINALLFLRGGLTGEGHLLLWGAGVLLLTAIAMWGWGRRRPVAAHVTPVNRLTLLGVTWVLLIVALLAILAMAYDG